ncbi:hypothetical protein EMIT07CA2_40578 [Brevibacillus sp. IT-7CA2]|uniref:hypothetical protein n=1 Tax=Brevibacillus sp. IT-7CA2 TaxID=3026436 RepID=UPI0039DF8E74
MIDLDIDFYRKWACQKMIESSQSNMWGGHWACAVIALTELLEEKIVPAKLEDLIRKNLDKVVEEHANEQQYRANTEYEEFPAQMMRLLVQKSHTCHALGHDVIYTFYLLSMLSRSHIPATAELFDAMGKMVSSFAASGPGFVTVNGERRYAVGAYPYAWSCYCRNETSLSTLCTRQSRSGLLHKTQPLGLC